MQREIEMSARTVDEAVELALRELDADRSDVEIDVVSRGKSGVLGIGSQPAVVRVTLAETDDAPSESLELATEAIESLIRYMDVDVGLTITRMHDEDLGGPVFDLEGEDAGLLIGRRGETLKTLQFLVRYMVSQRMDERVNLMIDVEGYQERRHAALRNMARRVASRVSDTGRAIALEPMPAYERRIVHVALSDYRGVTTESEGMGMERQVVVMPAE